MSEDAELTRGYRVLVDDNFHFTKEEERWCLGALPGLQWATEKGQGITAPAKTPYGAILGGFGGSRDASFTRGGAATMAGWELLRSTTPSPSIIRPQPSNTYPLDSRNNPAPPNRSSASSSPSFTAR
jgi:hypothetical protein